VQVLSHSGTVVRRIGDGHGKRSEAHGRAEASVRQHEGDVAFPSHAQRIRRLLHGLRAEAGRVGGVRFEWQQVVRTTAVGVLGSCRNAASGSALARVQNDAQARAQ
jgi:uncharacterized membrane protein